MKCKKTGCKMVIALLAAVVLLNPMLAQASDAPSNLQQSIISSRNHTIRKTTASISISGSTATCSGTVSLYSGMTSSIKITVYLEKSNAGSWSSIKSWSGSGGQLSGTYSVGRGTYRTKTVATSNGESTTAISASAVKS